MLKMKILSDSRRRVLPVSQIPFSMSSHGRKEKERSLATLL